MIRLSFGGNGRQTDSQTDSIDDGFMIPLPILPPPSQTEANLQQAQAQSVHCQDPQRTRSLPRCTAEPGDRHSLLPGPPSVSHLFSLPSVSLLPLTVPVLFVFKNAPAGLNAAN